MINILCERLLSDKVVTVGKFVSVLTVKIRIIRVLHNSKPQRLFQLISSICRKHRLLTRLISSAATSSHRSYLTEADKLFGDADVRSVFWLIELDFGAKMAILEELRSHDGDINKGYCMSFRNFLRSLGAER